MYPLVQDAHCPLPPPDRHRLENDMSISVAMFVGSILKTSQGTRISCVGLQVLYEIITNYVYLFSIVKMQQPRLSGQHLTLDSRTPVFQTLSGYSGLTGSQAGVCFTEEGFSRALMIVQRIHVHSAHRENVYDYYKHKKKHLSDLSLKHKAWAIVTELIEFFFCHSKVLAILSLRFFLSVCPCNIPPQNNRQNSTDCQQGNCHRMTFYITRSIDGGI